MKVKTLQVVFINPYDEQPSEVEKFLTSWKIFCSTRTGLKTLKWESLIVLHILQTDQYNCGVIVSYFLDNESLVLSFNLEDFILDMLGYVFLLF